MVAAPLASTDVMLGHLGWMAIRLSMAGAAFLIVAALLGALASPLAVCALPAAVLTGLAFAAPLTAFAATQETDHRFAARDALLSCSRSSCSPARSSRSRSCPVDAGRRVGVAALARRRAVPIGHHRPRSPTAAGPRSSVHLAIIMAFVVVGRGLGHAHLRTEVGGMSTVTTPLDERPPERPGWMRLLPGASVPAAFRLVERNIVAWKGIWLVVRLGAPRTDPVPVVDRGRRGRAGRRRHRSGWHAGALPRLRGHRPARGGRHVRPDLRRHLQLLRQAEVLPPLRRGARQPDAADGRRERRVALVAASAPRSTPPRSSSRWPCSASSSRGGRSCACRPPC